MLDVTEEDKEILQDIVSELGCKMPNVKMSIYKNRRGSYNRCFLWMCADKGTCRFETVFVTNYEYKTIDVQDIKVIVGSEID